MVRYVKIKVRITSESTGVVEAELFDDLSPNTFRKIVEALPFEGVARRWGDEVYFEIPVHVPEENAVEIVEKGTVAYWPPGHSLCIFWGPTPASRHPDEIRPASPVNVVGRVLGDPTVFSRVKYGERIRVERAE